MMRRVAVFGGSFNPPHKGHRKICRYLLAKAFDEVWVVPVYRHAFGKPLAPFKHRIEMCRLITRGLSRVKVLDTERRIGGISRTIRTLESLARCNPSTRFSLVVGADAMKETGTWLSFDGIRRLARIVVIPRQGAGGTGPFLSPLSSTEIRAKLARGISVRRECGECVDSYIDAHALYRRGGRAKPMSKGHLTRS